MLPGTLDFFNHTGRVLSLLVFLTGLAFAIKGFSYSMYARFFENTGKLQHKNNYLIRLFTALADKLTSIYPLSILKSRLMDNPVFIAVDRARITAIASVLSFIVFLLALGLFTILYREETLWYVKLLVAAISFFLPWYTTFLILDIYKYHVERQIPQMIDEFRSCFLKHGKIKPALLESCSYIDKSLGRIIYKAADAAFIEKSLEALKLKINNIWFNIFVILLTNYKQNGGELIDQLYRLNRTMSRYVNIEKKRSKRLIWYEVFALAISAFSIPAIIWLNSTIVQGIETSTNPGTNFVMARLIGFSMLSLLIVRVMRRM